MTEKQIKEFIRACFVTGLSFATPVLVIHVAKHLFNTNWHHKYWEVYLMCATFNVLKNGWISKDKGESR